MKVELLLSGRKNHNHLSIIHNHPQPQSFYSGFNLTNQLTSAGIQSIKPTDGRFVIAADSHQGAPYPHAHVAEQLIYIKFLIKSNISAYQAYLCAEHGEEGVLRAHIYSLCHFGNWIHVGSSTRFSSRFQDCPLTLHTPSVCAHGGRLDYHRDGLWARRSGNAPAAAGREPPVSLRWDRVPTECSRGFFLRTSCRWKQLDVVLRTHGDALSAEQVKQRQPLLYWWTYTGERRRELISS